MPIDYLSSKKKQHPINKNTSKHNKTQSPKMILGKSFNQFEQQADIVANKVVDSHSQYSRNVTSTSPLKSSSAASKGGIPVSNCVSDKINDEIGKRRTPDGDVSKRMQNMISMNFDDVNIHTDSKANALAQSVNSKAFTVGKDVFFDKVEYQPQTSSGKHLLAHELTHVAQQKNNTGPQTIQRTVRDSEADEKYHSLVYKDLNEEELKQRLALEGYNNEQVDYAINTYHKSAETFHIDWVIGQMEAKFKPRHEITKPQVTHEWSSRKINRIMFRGDSYRPSEEHKTEIPQGSEKFFKPESGNIFNEGFRRTKNLLPVYRTADGKAGDIDEGVCFTSDFYAAPWFPLEYGGVPYSRTWIYVMYIEEAYDTRQRQWEDTQRYLQQEEKKQNLTLSKALDIGWSLGGFEFAAQSVPKDVIIGAIRCKRFHAGGPKKLYNKDSTFAYELEKMVFNPNCRKQSQGGAVPDAFYDSAKSFMETEFKAHSKGQALKREASIIGPESAQNNVSKKEKLDEKESAQQKKLEEMEFQKRMEKAKIENIQENVKQTKLDIVNNDIIESAEQMRLDHNDKLAAIKFAVNEMIGTRTVVFVGDEDDLETEIHRNYKTNSSRGDGDGLQLQDESRTDILHYIPTGSIMTYSNKKFYYITADDNDLIGVNDLVNYNDEIIRLTQELNNMQSKNK